MIKNVKQAGSPRKWLVFYTASRSEKKCEERLQQRDIEVFLPKCKVLRQWKDRKKEVIEPLFRNYIFALVDEKERLLALETPGIVRCVFFDGRSAEISDSEIEKLRVAQNDSKRLSLLGQWVPPVGEQVRVVEGPLEGLVGEVIEQRGQVYVLVRIEAIRQVVKINVPASWVRSLKDTEFQFQAKKRNRRLPDYPTRSTISHS